MENSITLFELPGVTGKLATIKKWEKWDPERGKDSKRVSQDQNLDFYVPCLFYYVT